MTLYELTFGFVLEFGKDSNGKLDIKKVTTKNDYEDLSLKIYSYNSQNLVAILQYQYQYLIDIIKGIVDKYFLRGLIQEKLDGVGTKTLNIIRQALLECEEHYKLECLLIPF